MITRKLGRTDLMISPIAIGGAAFAYEHKSTNWFPKTEAGSEIVIATLNKALNN